MCPKTFECHNFKINGTVFCFFLILFLKHRFWPYTHHSSEMPFQSACWVHLGHTTALSLKLAGWTLPYFQDFGSIRFVCVCYVPQSHFVTKSQSDKPQCDTVNAYFLPGIPQHDGLSAVLNQSHFGDIFARGHQINTKQSGWKQKI